MIVKFYENDNEVEDSNRITALKNLKINAFCFRWKLITFKTILNKKNYKKWFSRNEIFI